jgi:hypothetical protein
MVCARNVKRVFSPLDEELDLLPGGLTPSLQEDIVRLGTWMPFRRVVGEVQHFRHTDVSKSTIERLTEKAGAAYVAVQNGEVERIERELPTPPLGPAQQFLSVDGAMVPLVGGEWAEVRTLVIGDVLPPQQVKGEQVVSTANHSYFSRMLDANTFQRLALVETQRRGVESAQAVAVVTDGAEWIQKFVDHHRFDAVRILDFPHAAEYISTFAQALWGVNSGEKTNWLDEQLRQLKTAGAAPVLTTLRQAAEQQAECPELTGALAYLEKRTAHMQYPTFRAAGWPIGDGAVESANKLVVEARLKGSGMHWVRPNVDPMLALRNIACNDRWAEAWPQIAATLRQHAQQRATQRRHQRHLLAATGMVQPTAPTTAPTTQTHSPPRPSPQPSDPPAPRQPWRPPPEHPWRHMPIGRARYNPPWASPTAKL